MLGRHGKLGGVFRGFGARLWARASSPRANIRGPAQPIITQPVVEANLGRLFGNTRSEANAANDRGRVPDNLPMEHLLLQLRRPPVQEQALTQLIDQLARSPLVQFPPMAHAQSIRRQVRPSGIGYSADHQLAARPRIPRQCDLCERHDHRFFRQCGPGACRLPYRDP